MDIGIVGAGIVGLAVARELALTRGARVTVLDKEDRVGAHQTGHNSGVVHAGLYYRPGSLKAKLCRDGVALLREYCAEHAIPYDEVGKLVIASTPPSAQACGPSPGAPGRTASPVSPSWTRWPCARSSRTPSGWPPSTPRTPRSSTSRRSPAAWPGTWRRPAVRYGSRTRSARCGRPRPGSRC
nr:hypothetical protein GCM10020093_066070 [Planobispora longispora]